MFLHEGVELLVRALLSNLYFLVRGASNSKLLLRRRATFILANHVAWLVTLATAATVSHFGRSLMLFLYILNLILTTF